MKQQKRTVTITAMMRDKLTKTAKRVADALGLTDKQQRMIAKSGRLAAAGLNLVNRSSGKLIRTMVSLKSIVGGTIVALAGFLALRTINRLIGQTVSEIDDLAKTAKRIGTSTEELSKLAFAAQQTGTNFEQLQVAVRTGLKNLQQFVIDGTGEAARGLEILGLGVEDITDGEGRLLKVTEILEIVSERLADVDNAAERIAASQFLFGRGGFQVLTLLQDGTSSLKELSDEAERLGAVITAREAQAAERLADAFGRVRSAFLGLRAGLITQIADVLENNLDRLAFFIADLEDRVARIRQLISTAFFDSTASKDDREEAQRQFKELIDGLRLALLGAASALLDAIISAFKIGAKAGGVIFGQLFGDALQDALADTFPGLFDPSERTQLVRRVQDLGGFEEPTVIEDFLGSGESFTIEINNPDLQKAREDLKAFEDEREASLKQQQREIGNLTKDLGNSIGEVGRFFQRLVLNRIDALPKAAEEAAGESEKPIMETGRSFAQMFNQARNSLANLAGQAQQQFPQLTRAIAGQRAEGFELNARRASATGDDVGAARLRLQARQTRELADAEQSRIGVLVELQRLELARFDLDARAATLLERLQASTEQLRLAEEQRQRDVENGLITKEQANRLNREGREELRLEGEAAVEALQNVKTESPELIAIVDEAIEKVRELMEVSKDSGEELSTFGDGFRDRFQAYVDEVNDNVKLGRDLADQTTSSISGLGDAFVDAASGLKTWEDAFIGWARTALDAIARVIARAAIARLVTSALGLGGSAGSAAGSAAAGGFNLGGFIPGRGPDRDTVTIGATPGEFMLRRKAADYYGARILHALNARLIPRAAFAGMSLPTNQAQMPGRTAFNTGGAINMGDGAAAAPAAADVAGVLVANEKNARQIFESGRQSLQRILDELGYRRG